MNASHNDTFQQFVKLLEENGRSEQARELALLLAYMDNMSRQFDNVLSELQEVKAQLAQAKESPVKKMLGRMTDALENKVLQARRLLRNLREKIMSCAAHAVENFKTAGASALDKAVSAMHVKPMLESLQQKISGMIAGTEENMAKVEETGHKLRSAGGFLKNAGRALTGRETYWVDGGQAGHIQAAVLAPLRAVRAALSGMNRATLAALRGVEHLGRAEETREEKRSVRRFLLENRPKVLALPAPAQEKKRKTPEAAL